MARGPQPYDITFDPDPLTDDGNTHLNLGLMLYREPGKGGAYQIASDPGQETTLGPVYRNGGQGMGFTEEWVNGGYGGGIDVDTSTNGVVLPAGRRIAITDGFVGHAYGTRSALDYSGNMHFVTGRAWYQIVLGTGTTAQLLQDLGPTFGSGDAVVFNNKIYAGGEGTPGVGGFLNIWQYDGTTFTQAVGVARLHLGTVTWDPNGVPAYTLIGSSSTYEIKWCTADPMVAGNWTSALIVGDSHYHIRSIVCTGHTAWIVKQEGVFWITGQGLAVNVTPYWRNSYDVDNGLWAVIVGRYMYAARGFGVDRIPLTGERQDGAVPCEIGAYQSYAGPVYGRPTAACESNGKLIVAYFNDTANKSYIMFGTPREADEQDPRPMIWNGPYSVIDGRCTQLKIESPPIPQYPNIYLYIWASNDQTSAYTMYRQYMAKGGSNYQELLNGGAPEFQDYFEWNVPDGWNAPTSRRVPYRYDVHADRLGGNTQISVWAKFDREGDYINQGAVFTSPRESFIPASISNSAYRVDYKIIGQGSTLDPPVFRAFEPRADVNREQDPIWMFRFKVASGQHMLDAHGRDPQDVETTKNNLWSLQSENATPITMLDTEGNETVVQILPGITVEEVERRGSNGQSVYDTVWNVRLRFLYSTWYWDSGVDYDSGRIWG